MPDLARTHLSVVIALALLLLTPWQDTALAASADRPPTIIPRAITEGPIEVRVAALREEPFVDGRDLEWEEVPEVAVPLWPTVERDPDNHLGPVDLHLKAAIYEKTLYLRLVWPDPLPNATHRSLAWDFTANRYRPDTDLEDRLAVRLGWDERFSACPLTAGPHKADLWLWRAARNNPVGFAEDAVQIANDSPLRDGRPWRLPDGKVRWLAIKPDEGAAFTFPVTYDRYRGDIVPQLIVKEAEKLGGSLKDVAAKGIWLEGFWTLEMARAFDTGHPDDVFIKPGTVLQVSFSASNHDEGAHESVSPLVKLVIPPDK